MKANELMIGDWVNIYVFPNESPKEKDLFPAIITTIMTPLPNEQGGEHIECIFKSKDGGIGCATRPVNTCLPIPITPEILEKNGFKFDGSGQCSMMFLSKPQFAEGLRFNIYVGLKRKTIEVFAAHPIEKSPNWRKSNKVYLEVCGCYVHELQHALRLCGIEKEIEL